MIKSINDYKKTIRKNKILVSIVQLLLVTLILLGWELLATFNIINEFLLSKPSSILSLFIIYLKNGTLFNHLSVSTLEALLALFISTSLLISK